MGACRPREVGPRLGGWEVAHHVAGHLKAEGRPAAGVLLPPPHTGKEERVVVSEGAR